MSLPLALQRLIRELHKLPTIGEKSATRLAYYLASTDRSLGANLAAALTEAIASIRLCRQCYHISDGDICTICQNQNRDPTIICVVEKPMDVIALERGGDFRGLYHVLHGVWAPLKGQGTEKMRLPELLARVKSTAVHEVILATGSTVEGDATALYIARLLAEVGVRSSRLAQGMPKGGELEFADDVTLSRALAGRSTVHGG